MNEVTCVICGLTGPVDTFQAIPTVRGAVSMCADREACQERAAFLGAQQRGVPVSPAPVGPAELDPVDDFLERNEPCAACFAELCECYAGQRVQVMLKNVFTTQQGPSTVLQARLKAVAEDCLVLGNEFGSLFVRLDSIQALGRAG